MNTIRFTDMAVIDAMPPEYREGQIVLLEMELIVAQMDSHFTTWMHCYMLTDFDTPLIDPNCVPLDTRGEIVDVVHSLPIRRPDQSSLRAVLAKLQELLIPPNHPSNRMTPYKQHIEHV